MNTKQIIDQILKTEGGYVNDPADKGGETNYGITVAVARANGYVGPMRDMPVEVARAIYEKRYITQPGFGEVGKISVVVAEELVDTGVNMGQTTAAKFFQRALNLFNVGSGYEILSVDGNLGPASLAAFKRYMEHRGADGEKVLVRVLNTLQGALYIDICTENFSQKKFIFGWFLNRVS